MQFYGVNLQYSSFGKIMILYTTFTMNLSIVLPIFNEEHIIDQSILDIIKKSKQIFSKIEILAIDDGSTDRTLAILKRLRRKEKRIKIINHKINKGYGACLRSGIIHAKFDWIFFTDSDMQFNVDEIAHFLPHTNKFDFIVGYRKQRADSLRRKIISKIYNKIVKIIFGLPLKDVDCAFKLMRKSALTSVKFHSNSFFMSVELMVKARHLGFRVKELGVHHYPRIKGISKVTYKRILLTIIDLVKLRLSLT